MGSKPFAYLRWALLGAAVILIGETLFYLSASDPIQVHAEGGPFESAQLGCWVLSLIVAAIGLLTSQGDARLLRLWLFTVVALAAARELDLLLWLTKHGGPNSVQFRADWWLKSGAPLWVKAAWGAGLAIVGWLLLVPALRAGRPFLRLLRTGDAVAGLFTISIICLVIGFACDDLLRHAGLPREPLQGVEETFELFGSVAFLACAVASLRKPLLGPPQQPSPPPDREHPVS